MIQKNECYREELSYFQDDLNYINAHIHAKKKLEINKMVYAIMNYYLLNFIPVLSISSATCLCYIYAQREKLVLKPFNGFLLKWQIAHKGC